MWEAVAMTVAAAAGNNIGKVLQKQGTKGLPQLSLNLKVIQKYGASRTWVTGVAVDIAGALLMIKAVAQAPISVVQPVAGCGLAVLAIFSHFYLHEAMHALDWVGVVMAVTGTIAVGVTGEEQKEVHISLMRLLLFFVWLALFFGMLNCWARSRKRPYQKHDPADSPLGISREADVMEEIAAGMEAGACFGLSAAVCRMGFILVERGMSSWFVPAAIAVGICCSTGGFFCQTRGLKDGRAVVVSTCAAVASIVIGVLVGLFALGESLPASSIARCLHLLAWVLIILGIIVLLTSEKLGPVLPRSMRRFVRPKGNLQQKGFPTSRGGSLSRRDMSGSTSVHIGTGTGNAQLKTPPSKYRPSD